MGWGWFGGGDGGDTQHSTHTHTHTHTQTEFVCCRSEPFLLANKDFRDEFGSTALMIASRKGCFSIDLLLKAGVEKDAKCDAGSTALMIASRKGCFNALTSCSTRGLKWTPKTTEGVRS